MNKKVFNLISDLRGLVDVSMMRSIPDSEWLCLISSKYISMPV